MYFLVLFVLFSDRRRMLSVFLFEEGYVRVQKSIESADVKWFKIFIFYWRAYYEFDLHESCR